MNIQKAFILVVSTTLAFTIMGGLIGFVMGRFLPNYYRSIFSNGRDPDFDPLAIGIGQGLTQGITAGAVIGVILVIIVGRYQTKASSRKEN